MMRLGGGGPPFRGGRLVGRRGRGGRHPRGALPGLRGTLLLLLCTLAKIYAVPLAKIHVAGGWKVVQVACGALSCARVHGARIENPDVVLLSSTLEGMALGALGCSLIEDGLGVTTTGALCRVRVDNHILRCEGA